MAHVFVSYAREDQEYVRRIVAGVETGDRDAWVDWEGIPPTAEWFAEIRAAIDAADACLFVISPAFAASEVCRQEVEYAASANKRLVPVVIEEPVDGEVPPELRKLNWVFLRETDPFEDALGTLREAIDLDLDFTRQHARLLVRAREWEAGDDDSLLLRGADLQEALQWLSEAAAGKEPKPTRAHTSYIEASQRHEAAEVERWQQLYGRAMSRQLAMQAAGEPDRRLGLLLAVEAVAQQPTLEARRTLLELLLATNDVVDGAFADAEVVDLALHPGGGTVAAALAGGTIGLWLIDGEGWDPGASWPAGLTEVAKVAFSPDGAQLAGCGSDGIAVLWDAATGAEVRRFDLESDAYSMCLAFSPDGGTLAVGTGDRVRLLDPATGDLRLPPLEHRGDVTCLAFDPGGSLLAAGNGAAINVLGGPVKTWVTLWDLASGERRVDLAGHTGVIHGLAFSPDGAFLVSGGLDGRLLSWDPAAPQSRDEPPASPGLHGGVSTVAFAPDGRTMVSAGADHTVAVVDVAASELRELWGVHRQAVIGAAVTPDSRRAVTASLDRSLIRWDLRGGEPRGRPLAGHDAAVAGVAVHPAGTQLASGDLEGRVVLWDPASREPLHVLTGHGDAVWSVAYSPDGKLLATAGFDETLRLWDPATGEPRGAPRQAGSPFIGNVAFSPDGAAIACVGGAAIPAAGDSEVVVWRVAGDGERRLTAVEHGKLAGVAFSPDGRTLAAGTWNGAVLAWDLGAADPSPELLFEHGEAVMAVAFSPDGALLAAGGGSWVGQGDNHVALWDVARRERRFDPLAAHETTVSSLSFSGDGSLLASGGGSVHGGAGQPGIIVWDVAAGIAVSPLMVGHGDAVMSVAFDPTRRRLASGGKDGVVRLWNLDLDDWVGLARRKAGRQLTEGERRRYLPDDA